jgi:putative ATPase
LSRCQVYILEALQESDLQQVVHQAMDKDAWLKEKAPLIQEWEALFRFSGGDARKLLNTLELVVSSIEDTPIVLTNAIVMEVVQQKMALYDKTGEQHYDIISAFIKSIRGSDPNAAVYWLARMVAGGEDPTFIARRMLILASEDIGNANPNALLLAQSCFQSVSVIGWPESRIILSQCAIYLACSAKSNASYMAIEDALAQVKATGDLPVPLALRNAPTKLMKNIGYGADYQYAHAYENNFVAMEFMPNGLEGRVFYEPGNNAQEEKMKQFLKNNWKEKYQ